MESKGRNICFRVSVSAVCVRVHVMKPSFIHTGLQPGSRNLLAEKILCSRVGNSCNHSRNEKVQGKSAHGYQVRSCLPQPLAHAVQPGCLCTPDRNPKERRSHFNETHGASATQGRSRQTAPCLRIPVISRCCLHILCVLG